MKTQRTRSTQSSEGVPLFSASSAPFAFHTSVTLDGGISFEVAGNGGETLTTVWGTLLGREFLRAAFF